MADVAEVVAGTAFPKSLQGRREGKFPVFKVGEISRASQCGQATLYDSPNNVESGDLKGNAVPAGAVVFAKIGEALKLNRRAIIGREAFIDNNVMALIPNENVIDSRYLYYFSLSLDLSPLSRATAVPSIRKSDVNEVLVPTPSLGEQERIVEEIEKQFTRLDAAVEALKRTRANLARYRASILLAAADGSLMGANHQCDWEEVRVEEVAELFQYGTSEKAGSSGEIPVLGMGNIDPWGGLKFNKLKYLPAGHKDLPKLLLEVGDVLFNRTNSAEQVGKTAVYEGQLGACTFASYLIRVRLRERCSPHFLTYLTNSGIGRRWVKSVVSQQVGQANVSGGKFKNFSFRLPPRAVQDKIVDETQKILSIIDSMEIQVRKEQQRSSALRQAILSRAFSGRLVGSH